MNLSEAARYAGVTRQAVLWRLQKGRLNGWQSESGGWHIEADELDRAFLLNNQLPEDGISVDEAAEILGCTSNMVYKLVNAGRIMGVRTTRYRLVISRASVEDHMLFDSRLKDFMSAYNITAGEAAYALMRENVQLQGLLKLQEAEIAAAEQAVRQALGKAVEGGGV
jgi:excisionase family DNA binding protein